MFVFFGFQATVMQNEENKIFLCLFQQTCPQASSSVSVGCIWAVESVCLTVWIISVSYYNRGFCVHIKIASPWFYCSRTHLQQPLLGVWEFFELFGKMMIKYNHVSVWFVWWKMVKFQTVFPILFTVGLKCGSCSGLTKCRIYLKKSIASWQKLNYHKL